MRNKPLIFQILSALFLVEPLIKILYFKAATHFDFGTIFENIISRSSFREIFDFWIVFPIAGIMLWKLRKWTYFAFLGVMAYLIFSIATYEKYTWPYNSDRPLFYHYFIIAITLFTIAYFLVPDVRAPFFNKKLRWWESKPRYRITIPAKITGNKITFQSEIMNISQTGAFLKDNNLLTPGDVVSLTFESEGLLMEIPVKVISRHVISSTPGFGVQFYPTSVTQKFQLFRLIGRIRNQRYM
jgi:hypothetical protein